MKSHFKLIIIIFCLCFIFSLTSKGKAELFYSIYATPPTFNPRAVPAETTTISAGLWADTYPNETALYWVRVYDINHVLVDTPTYPVDTTVPNITSYGEYYVVWDGKDASNIIVNNGIYPYHIDAVSWVSTKVTATGAPYPLDVVNYYYYEYFDEDDNWEYDVVFVSDINLTTLTGRIRRSIDEGAWTDVTPPGFSGYAYGLAATSPVAANSDGKIYALSSAAPHRLHYTQDSGITWSYYPLWADAITPSDLACSPDGPIFYAVDKGTNKVYKSIDSGANWNQCTAQPGLAALPSLTGVAVDPNNSNIVLVADGANGDIFKSDNGCNTGFTIIFNGTANQAYQVSIDNEGYYWMSNVANRRVSEGNPINNLEVERIGTGAGDQKYKFNAGGVALGLFVNYSPWLDNKYLYVADYLNKKFKKYVYDNYGSDPPVGTNIVVSLTGDITPPAAITDLSIAHEWWWDPWDVVGSDFLWLQWTAPGNDGNAPATKVMSYDVRYSKTSIIEGNFNAATPTIFEYTSHATNNLINDTTFEVQENISEGTPSSGSIYVIDYPDRSVQSYSYTSWSGKIFYLYTGEQLDRTYDGNDKVLSDYFYSPQGGYPEYFEVPGLESNTTYYFAIKSSDEKPNISGLSNTPVSGKTGLLLEWNMVSCPLQPIPSDSLSVFGDDAALDWMFKWISTWTGPTDTNCTTSCQTVGDGLCPHVPPPQCYCNPDCDGSWVQISTIVPGEGIFLYSTKNYDPTDATGADIIDSSYTVSLNTGWNLIGNPYGTIVDLSACNVTYNSVTKSYADSVAAGWIDNAIYIWNGITYIDYAYTDPALLELWKGYWVKAYHNLDLIINKP